MARAYKALPPASELWERFEYKPLTGELIRKGAGYTRPDVVGNRADHLNKALGYKVVNWYGSRLYAHRVIWAWVTGDSDVPQLDHKNERKYDNHWGNLRPATQSQNMANRAKVRGTYPTASGKWQAKITKDGRSFSLGTYSTQDGARAAYEKASQEFHGEFSGVR